MADDPTADPAVAEPSAPETLEMSPVAAAPIEGTDIAAPGKDKAKKDKKKSDASRGVETLYRVTFDNHIQLSQLADNKANMLVSINGLIISVLIALVAPRASEPDPMIFPALLLMLGCAISLFIAIIASRPRIVRSPISVADVARNSGNLLFFSEFTTMSPEAFSEAMGLLRDDRKLLYDNMNRELHSLGVVLVRKYARVQWAYTAFMFTIGIAVFSFLVMAFMTFA
ncbi:MAG: hypothetical protein H6978_15720 [Gammaproteobacteria bacterium]|nr:hypothetical protein [Gammaproteobacteria bacterium]